MADVVSWVSIRCRRALVLIRVAYVPICAIVLCVLMVFPLTSISMLLRLAILIVLIVLILVSRALRRLLIVVWALRWMISGRLIVGHWGRVALDWLLLGLRTVVGVSRRYECRRKKVRP